MLVLYDRDCGLCAWLLAVLLHWDRERRLRPRAIQSEQGERSLAGIDADQRLASWHVRDARGQLRSGGAALAPVLRSLPGGRPLAALADASPRATALAYRWIAEHRSLLSRPLSSGSKARARALIARRERAPQPGARPGRAR